MLKVELSNIYHKGEECIAISIPYDFSIKEYIKGFPGIQWSNSKRCFYFHYSEIAQSEFRRFIENGGYLIKDPVIVETVSVAKKSRVSKNNLPRLNSEKIVVHKNFVSFLIGKRYSKSTVNVYSAFILEFLRFSAERPTEELKEDDVRNYIEWAVQTLNYSISTHRQLISAFRHFAYFYPLCQIDPEKLHRPKRDQKLPTVLNMKEVLHILQVTKNMKHKTVIALLYSSGLRIGELIDLELHCFDFTRKQIHIKHAKGRKDRYVVLAESILPLLKQYFEAYRPKQYLVENPKGGKYSPASIRSFLKQSCKLAGITKRVTPHTLRHSYATHLHESGTGLRYIQELLGHSKPETTMIYTHVSTRDVRDVRSPLDLALMQSTAPDKHDKNLLLPGSSLPDKHDKV